MQQTFSANLSIVLAHSVLFFTREEYSPNGVVDDARNGGDPPAPTVAASTGDQMYALTQNLPGLIQAASANIPGLEEALFQSRASISPRDNALQLKLLQDYGPDLNRIGSDIAGQNQLSQVSNDTRALEAAKSSGLIDTELGLDRTINPEYYATRAATAKSLGDLLASININGLSGSERAEIERAVNRNNVAGGNDGVGSALNTAQNASVFGSALQKKRDALGTAIDKATSFLPASRTNIDPFKLATGKESTSNVGQTAFAGTSQGIGQGALGLTSGLLAQTGENLRTGMNINANRRDELDRYNETASSTGSLLSSICCWIFLESYNGKLPWFVRVGRDFHYRNEPRLAVGYKRMAMWLVPLMKRFNIIRFLVNYLMVKPMTCYGGWMFNVEGFKHGKKYSFVQNFWFNVWRLMAK